MPPLHLTLCVIVRDEALDLAGLLAGPHDLWDECVVVDTGSRDTSAEVAIRAGARVIHQPWRDDFSTARNAGLDAARGRWALVLDCDERLAPADRKTLRRLVLGPADRAWSLPQWNYTDRRDLPDARLVPAAARDMARGADTYVEARQIRLFPRRRDLRYAGNVHESLDEAMALAGVVVERLELPIHHYGHLPEMNKTELRNSLYGRLLRQKIRVNPEEPLARYELGVQLANEGRHQLAERLLARTVRDAPGGLGVYKARLLLGRLLTARGEIAAAACQTAHAVRERPDQQVCWVAAVRQHAAAGLEDTARLYLTQGLALFPHEAQLRSLYRQDFRHTADNAGVDGSRLQTGTAIATVGTGKHLDGPGQQAGKI